MSSLNGRLIKDNAVTIFKDSFSTTVGTELNIKPLENALAQFIIKGGAPTSLGLKKLNDVQPLFITGMDDEINIPLFAHPVLVNISKKDYLFADMRTAVKKDSLDYLHGSDQHKAIRNSTEFKFIYSRTALSLAWLNGEQSHIGTRLSYGATIFTSWISTALANTYGLDWESQLKLRIVILYYYSSLFLESHTEESVELLVNHIIKTTNMKSSEIFPIIDACPPPKNVLDLVGGIRSVFIDNPRLRDLDIRGLLTTLHNSWYGKDANEIIPMALEHPPTWLAMVYTVSTERSYRNSMLSKIAIGTGSKGKQSLEQFTKSFADLMNLYKEGSI